MNYKPGKSELFEFNLVGKRTFTEWLRPRAVSYISFNDWGTSIGYRNPTNAEIFKTFGLMFNAQPEPFYDSRHITILKHPNKYGNFNRWTDTKGGQDYDDLKLVDNLNGTITILDKYTKEEIKQAVYDLTK